MSKISADALLKAVYVLGCEEERGPLQDYHCRYCGVWLDQCGRHEPEPHAKDCLYLQIEEYLQEIGELLESRV